MLNKEANNNPGLCPSKDNIFCTFTPRPQIIFLSSFWTLIKPSFTVPVKNPTIKVTLTELA
jgi:hypothetical protein